MTTYNLYTTDGCHLCEQAIGLFYYAKQQQLIANDVALKMIDIVEDDKLVERYGVSIPVLQHPISKQELNWPFDLDGLVGFINNDNQSWIHLTAVIRIWLTQNKGGSGSS